MKSGKVVLRPSVRRFAEEMERKLRKHDAERGERGWIRSSNEYLFYRLLEEVGELAASMRNEVSCQNECIDVANFAMMLFDRDSS